MYVCMYVQCTHAVELILVESAKDKQGVCTDFFLRHVYVAAVLGEEPQEDSLG